MFKTFISIIAIGFALTGCGGRTRDQVMKTLLLIIGIVFMPFFYFGFILAGIYTPMSDLYKSLVEHYKSNEPFGGFDA
jgi:uncharacterized phage infection (PIP) family protein YhgE